MSSLESILNSSASGMSAESIRMNTISSNLANANSVGATEDATYHKKYPIFSEVTNDIQGLSESEQPMGGVQVSEITHSQKPLVKHYDPSNPLADKAGFVFQTDVNPLEEMTDMISASREYQANVEAMNTAKSLIMQSINALKE